jgi:3-phosphoshikimate 1-carboxyvinyltransferase
VTDLVVHPSKAPLVGSVPVPGDKSIAHRAILFAGLAAGRSRIEGGAMGEDNRATLAALVAMGARAEEVSPGVLDVDGVGERGLSAPASDIDCGNSGTTMRLLAGVLSAQRFASRLVGDPSLSRRPMERVARPLRLRGARIEGQIDPKRVGDITAPLVIGPLPATHALDAIEYAIPIASAQVKSAILLSGLWSEGDTFVREPTVSRDHTERLLQALGARIRTVGPMVALEAPAFDGAIPSFSTRVPGDPSAAAFLVAAALLVPGSRVDVRRVGTNPTRLGFFEVLRDMGAAVILAPLGDELGEPIGDVHAAASSLHRASIGGETITRAIDEVPILCALAARASGVTSIVDAAELRVKESDRIAAMATVLRAFGVSCEEHADGLAIEGQPEGALRAADVASGGDHRIAMTAVVLGLLADGPTRVRDADCIATSFPRFVGTLRALGARIEVEENAP